MKLQALFASPISTHRLMPASSPFLREIRSETHLIRRGDHAGRDWSKDHYHRGYTSYSSLDQLHRFSSTFLELEKRINPCVDSYIKALGLQVRPREVRLTRMWLNMMGEGCTHPMHIHPLSVISGTFYVQTPARSAAIRFEDPRAGLFMARPLAKPSLRGQSSPLHHEVNPRAGELVLFESWIRHEVPPHGAKTERISISFNYDWVGD